MTAEFDPTAVDPDGLVLEMYEAAAEKQNSPHNKTLLVAERLEDQLGEIDPIERTDHYAAVALVLSDIASDSVEDAEAVIRAFESRSAEIASKVGWKGIKADTIRGNCLVLVKEQKRENSLQAVEELKADGELTLSLDNIGLDEYIEDYLQTIIRATPEDAVNDDELIFVFDEPDGQVRIEVEADVPTNRTEFFDAIRSATSMQVRNKITSWQLKDEFDEDVTEDKSVAKQRYRKASLGPEARPWGSHPDLYEEAITHLIRDFEDLHETPGARSEAWERLQKKLETSQVTTTLDEAIAHTKPYWDEANQDILVPSTMVDEACDGIGVDRPNLYKEMDARGVTDRFSGNKISESRTASDGTAMRFWFFDATHPEVPEPTPDQLVDTLGGGLDNLLVDPVPESSDDEVAVDGGVTSGSDDQAQGDETESEDEEV